MHDVHADINVTKSSNARECGVDCACSEAEREPEYFSSGENEDTEDEDDHQSVPVDLALRWDFSFRDLCSFVILSCRQPHFILKMTAIIQSIQVIKQQNWIWWKFLVSIIFRILIDLK